ncbi:hypothetical protein NMG60_11003566 [Bertholletia excelsa]
MGGIAWSAEEDQLLKKCVEQFGEGKWHRIPLLAGLKRCRRSCRLRWLNYLRPNIKRGVFTREEVDTIVKLHKLVGNKWSLIASKLPGRTANNVKNYWNCHLSKKLNKQEEDEGKIETGGNLATSTTSCSSSSASVRSPNFLPGEVGVMMPSKEGEDESAAAVAPDKSFTSHEGNNLLGDDWRIEYDFGGGMGAPLYDGLNSITADADDFICDIDLWMN